jgi:CheY-like chemotaxis protein
MREMRILCVENRLEDMADLAYMLEEIGYEVMPAINREEAVGLFSKQAIDGVLFEYNPPDAAGTQIRDRLKSRQPDIPVLLFTGARCRTHGLTGVGTHTPFLRRFFDAYWRKHQKFGTSSWRTYSNPRTGR